MKNFRIVIVCLLWWLILAPWGYANQIDLKIFYVNDFHGFAEPHQPTGSAAPLGGIAYLAGAVDEDNLPTIGAGANPVSLVTTTRTNDTIRVTFNTGNTANADYATVGGGYNNLSIGNYATIGGGTSNSILIASATIGGGDGNTASVNASSGTIGGGWHNTVNGNTATGTGIFALFNGCIAAATAHTSATVRTMPAQARSRRGPREAQEYGGTPSRSAAQEATSAGNAWRAGSP